MGPSFSLALQTWSQTALRLNGEGGTGKMGGGGGGGGGGGCQGRREWRGATGPTDLVTESTKTKWGGWDWEDGGWGWGGLSREEGVEGCHCLNQDSNLQHLDPYSSVLAALKSFSATRNFIQSVTPFPKMTMGVRVNHPHSRLVGGPCPWGRRRCRTAKGRSWQTGTETQHKVQTMVNTYNTSIFFTTQSADYGQYLLCLNLFHNKKCRLWSISLVSQSFSQQKVQTMVNISCVSIFFTTKSAHYGQYLLRLNLFHKKKRTLWSISLVSQSFSQQKAHTMVNISCVSIFLTTKSADYGQYLLRLNHFHNKNRSLWSISLASQSFSQQKAWVMVNISCVSIFFTS